MTPAKASLALTVFLVTDLLDSGIYQTFFVIPCVGWSAFPALSFERRA